VSWSLCRHDLGRRSPKSRARGRIHLRLRSDVALDQPLWDQFKRACDLLYLPLLRKPLDLVALDGRADSRSASPAVGVGSSGSGGGDVTAAVPPSVVLGPVISSAIGSWPGPIGTASDIAAAAAAAVLASSDGHGLGVTRVSDDYDVVEGPDRTSALLVKCTQCQQLVPLGTLDAHSRLCGTPAGGTSVGTTPADVTAPLPPSTAAATVADAPDARPMDGGVESEVAFGQMPAAGVEVVEDVARVVMRPFCNTGSICVPGKLFLTNFRLIFVAARGCGHGGVRGGGTVEDEACDSASTSSDDDDDSTAAAVAGVPVDVGERGSFATDAWDDAASDVGDRGDGDAAASSASASTSARPLRLPRGSTSDGRRRIAVIVDNDVRVASEAQRAFHVPLGMVAGIVQSLPGSSPATAGFVYSCPGGVPAELARGCPALQVDTLGFRAPLFVFATTPLHEPEPAVGTSLGECGRRCHRAVVPAPFVFVCVSVGVCVCLLACALC
jgi:hypothetical protein